jgi:FMN reductase [NAD(P)H]
MNPVLELMHQHHSVRSYRDQPIPPEILDSILDAAWKGPTSMNGQQVSLVVTQDAEKRARISQIASGQPWIAQAPVFVTVVVDFHKSAQAAVKEGLEQKIHNSVEGFAMGTLDAGIALGNLMTAARSAGLGIVPIGGIRRDPQAMIDLLQLPKLTLPIAGVAIGYIDHDGSLKPRLARNSFVHMEQYDSTQLAEQIDQYDATLTAYWEQLQRTDGQPWSANTAQAYQKIYYPEVARVSRSQGFGFEQ